MAREVNLPDEPFAVMLAEGALHKIGDFSPEIDKILKGLGDSYNDLVQQLAAQFIKDHYVANEPDPDEMTGTDLANALYLLLVAGDDTNWLKNVTRLGLPKAIIDASRKLVETAREHEPKLSEESERVREILKAAEEAGL